MVMGERSKRGVAFEHELKVHAFTVMFVMMVLPVITLLMAMN